jgi:hypothetical protein
MTTQIRKYQGENNDLKPRNTRLAYSCCRTAQSDELPPFADGANAQGSIVARASNPHMIG